MRINGWTLQAGLLALLLLTWGCGRDPASQHATTGQAPAGAASSAAPPEHHHEHHAPHGGCLVELGEEFAHLELVLDSKTGQLTGYALDGEAENPVRLKQAAMTLHITSTRPEGGTSQTLTPPLVLQLTAMASRLSGETVGDTSQFEGQSDALKGVAQFQATLTAITIKNQDFSQVDFTYPQGNEEPSEKASSNAAKLQAAQDQIVPVSFELLGDFEYPTQGWGDSAPFQATQPALVIPDKIKALDGKRVGLQGFMLPMDVEDGKSRQFILMASIPGCLYCEPPRFNEFVVVTMPPDKAVTIQAMQPIVVIGRLSVGDNSKQEENSSFYRITGEAVTDRMPALARK